MLYFPREQGVRAKQCLRWIMMKGDVRAMYMAEINIWMSAKSIWLYYFSEFGLFVLVRDYNLVLLGYHALFYDCRYYSTTVEHASICATSHTNISPVKICAPPLSKLVYLHTFHIHSNVPLTKIFLTHNKTYIHKTKKINCIPLYF